MGNDAVLDKEGKVEPQDKLDQAAKQAAARLKSEVGDALREDLIEALKAEWRSSLRDEMLAALRDELAAGTGPVATAVKRSPRNERKPSAVRAWFKQHAGLALDDGEKEILVKAGWDGRFEIDLPVDPQANLERSTEADDVIPKRIAGTFIEELDTFAPVRTVAQVLSTTSMDKLRIPIGDDLSNEGELLSGSVTMTSVDPTLASVELDHYTIHSKPVVVEYPLLRDSAVDIEAWLGRILAERCGRKANEYFTTGTGSSQPQGLVPTGSDPVPVGVTAAATNAVTWQEILDLIQSVDQRYRKNAVFMMAPATKTAVMKLTDDNSRPLFWPSLDKKQPDTILGYPVVENPDMPTMAAGKKTIVFGDFKRFVIREVRKVRLAVLKERFVEYDALGFLAFYYVDSKVAATSNTVAIKCLKQAAS